MTISTTHYMHNRIEKLPATSHFISQLRDLQDPQPCNMEVIIANGSKVCATHVTETEIDFISDNKGMTPSTLLLANVYYIPRLSRRLSRRLVSLQSFTRYMIFSVKITCHFRRLHFGDGESFTWPINGNNNSNNQYAMSAMMTAPEATPSPSNADNIPTNMSHSH